MGTEKNAYMTRIEVRGLWNICDLAWELTPGVNILAGSNGSGKSTVLRCLSDLFTLGSITPGHRCRMQAMAVEFSDGTVVSSEQKFDPAVYNIGVVSTFDTTLQQSEAIFKLSDGTVATYLDWELYRLQNRYLTYQLEMGKAVIQALQKGKSTAEITEITEKKTQFFDILDELFEATDKRVDRDSDMLRFKLNNGSHIEIQPHQLSSGEKQILIILASVLIQGGRPFIMIMDEPEISLHFDWQKRLIQDVMSLNPNLQLVIATHSPAMVMNGWTDCVSEISDLVRPLGSSTLG